VQTSSSESGGQGRISQYTLNGGGEVVRAGWGDQQAARAVDHDLGKVSHAGCNHGSAKSARCEEQAT
jgi:hypothetical protein